MSFVRLKKNLIFLISAIILAAGFYVLQIYAAKTDKNFHLYFLNVGQGDSELIKTPDGKKILIDGGPGDSVLGELGKHLGYFERQIDLVILTHPHADHLEGLISVIKDYQVNQIFTADLTDDTPEFKLWQKLIAQKNIPLEYKKQGDNFCVSQVCFQVLAPFSTDLGADQSKLNEVSMVMMANYSGHKILFGADTDEQEEQKILSQNEDLGAEILKVPHHGSKTGLSDAFLAAVQPKDAVIEHGGSSAIPGLGGKGIIDIFISVKK